MDRNEAAAALAGVDNAKANLAAMNLCPPWRHAVFGLIMSLLVVGPSLGMPLQAGLTAAALGLVAVVVRDDRRRMGVFVNGYRRGTTRPVTLALAAVTVVLLAAEMFARERGLSLATGRGLAALEFIIATAGSVLWQRVFVRELRARSA